MQNFEPFPRIFKTFKRNSKNFKRNSIIVQNFFHAFSPPGFSGAAISVWAVSEEPAIDNHLEIAELAGCYDPETQTRADIPAVTACMQVRY